MTELSTIARPYARAVFQIAGDEKNLSEWMGFLRQLKDVIKDENIQAVLHDKSVGHEQILTLIKTIMKEASASQVNFLTLIANNKRLLIVPEIVSQVEALKIAQENQVDVTVRSAVDLSEAQRAKLTAKLEGRLGKTVNLHCEKDPYLIGGLVIEAGDLVIEKSIKDQLKRLRQTLATTIV